MHSGNAKTYRNAASKAKANRPLARQPRARAKTRQLSPPPRNSLKQCKRARACKCHPIQITQAHRKSQQKDCRTRQNNASQLNKRNSNVRHPSRNRAKKRLEYPNPEQSHAEKCHRERNAVQRQLRRPSRLPMVLRGKNNLEKRLEVNHPPAPLPPLPPGEHPPLYFVHPCSITKNSLEHQTKTHQHKPHLNPIPKTNRKSKQPEKPEDRKSPPAQ